MGEEMAQVHQRSLEIPAGLRVPRLERLLGCRLQDLTVAHVQRLVDLGVAEDLTLDFKRSRYEDGEKGIRELAKDAAMMANAAGGLIIVGVTESGGRATAIRPVALDERERQRMVDGLTRCVAPLIPDLVVEELPTDDTGTIGLFLIAVPPSDLAPHGIAGHNDHRMSWPVREDRDCRWMREPELAARYRDRFEAIGRQIDRLAVVADEGTTRLDRRTRCFLSVAAMPARAGRAHFDADAVRSTRGWLQRIGQEVPANVTGQRAMVGRRRITVSNMTYYAGFSDDFHLELHADGAAFAAVRLVKVEHFAEREGAASEELQPVRADDVEKWTLAFLRVLAAHAVQAGGGGDLAVQACLQPAPGYAMGIVEPYGSTATGPRILGRQFIPGSLKTGDSTPARTIVPLTVAADDRDLIGSAAILAAEILSEFGVECPRMLRIDGTVDAEQVFAPDHDTLVDWARGRGVLRGCERNASVRDG